MIPDYLHAAGQPQLVTAALSTLNLGQLPASLLALLAARQLGLYEAVLAAIQIVNLFGVAALLAWAPPLCVLGAGVIGFGCAFSLIISLALPPRLTAVSDVARLSAGTLAIGSGF